MFVHLQVSGHRAAERCEEQEASFLSSRGMQQGSPAARVLLRPGIGHDSLAAVCLGLLPGPGEGGLQQLLEAILLCGVVTEAAC